MHALSGRTADDVWRAAAELFCGDGPAQMQPGRGGATAEVLHVGLTISEPRQRWTFSRTPAMNPAFALVEVMWILSGRRDAGLPTYWNPALPRYAGHASDQEGAYGYRLRRHFGIDQLDRVYRALDSMPDSRQAVLQIWDVRADLPGEDGTPARPDIPCNVLALPKVRGGRLEWLQVLRSNDLFLGFPHNVVQFTAVQEVLAGWLGVELGAYHHLSDSLHVYERDIETVLASNESTTGAESFDTLALDRATSEWVIGDLVDRLDELRSPRSSEDSLLTLARTSSFPRAYENILLIAAADAARRRGWTEAAKGCVEACTNPALVLLWERWMTRMRRRAPNRERPL